MQLPSFTSRVVRHAAGSPLSLSVLGGAVVAAVVLASWPIAALGGMAYAALVASDAASAEFRQRVLGGPVRMPGPDQLRDPEVRAIAARIALGRDELAQIVKITPPRVQHNVAAALTAIDELERHAAGLARRADELSCYLAGVDPSTNRDEADRLALRAGQTRDPEARASYEAAALAARDRITALHDITTARHRALAHLARIELAIKGLPATLARLRALDDQATDALSGDVGAELERMTIDLRAFEQTLESIVEVTS